MRVDIAYKITMVATLIMMAGAMSCSEYQDIYNTLPETFSSQLSVPTDTVSDFRAEFELVRTISLPSDINIGQVTSLSVSPSGRFLVLDRVGNQALLLSENGALLRKLSNIQCSQAVSFIPVHGQFDQSGNIIIITRGDPWGYQFSGDGVCISSMDESFLPPAYFEFASNGDIIGLYNDVPYTIKRLTPTGTIINTFGTGKKRNNIVHHSRAGGVVLDNNDNSYLALPFSPYVYKFSKNGEFVATLGWKPQSYVEIDKDIAPFENVAQMSNAFTYLHDNFSVSMRLFLVSSETLALIFRNGYLATQQPGKEIGISLMDLQGRPIAKEEILGKRETWFMEAKNDLFYGVGQDSSSTNVLAPPTIKVYRLRME
jgi:hypothetical protein